jgi:glycerol-3-phosphate acyltransferase PlsY
MEFLQELPLAAKAPILIALAFLAGSIPFSMLIGLARGVDIRKVGSGNVGATNLGRALGRRYFYLGFALDMLKGLLPTLFAGLVLGTLGRYAAQPLPTLVWIGVALACMLGHVFSPWLRLRGGKGIATGFGALLAIFPVMTIGGGVALATFLATLALWRTISLSSLAATCSLPITLVLLFLARADDPAAALTRDSGPIYVVFTLMLPVLVIYTHWANIRRLRAGTEPRIGQRVAPPGTPG